MESQAAVPLADTGPHHTACQHDAPGPLPNRVRFPSTLPASPHILVCRYVSTRQEFLSGLSVHRGGWNWRAWRRGLFEIGLGGRDIAAMCPFRLVVSGQPGVSRTRTYVCAFGMDPAHHLVRNKASGSYLAGRLAEVADVGRLKHTFLGSKPLSNLRTGRSTCSHRRPAEASPMAESRT